MSPRRCFVISPIGEPRSVEREHADDVYKNIIKPALAKFGVEPKRAEEIAEPGRISHQMFRAILETDFCVAVLTDHNPNVFYEVAIAQAVAKPVLFIGADDEAMPFDVKDLRSIRYERAASRDNAACVAQLVKSVAALEARGWTGESLLELHGARVPALMAPSYDFDPLAAEVAGTLARLDADGGTRLRQYQREGDAGRVFDGVYASILYASSAAISGRVDAALYGNLMEFDVATQGLRVRYMAGPYNDEVSTRVFPLRGSGEGIASRAFLNQRVLVVNSMAEERRVRGEARLQAMVCVPVPGCNPAVASRQVALLNIDSGLEGVFPEPEQLHAHPAGARLDRLAALLAKTNALYRWIVEDGPRVG